MNERIQRLLNDPKARAATLLVARRLADGLIDEAAAAEQLDFVEAQLVEPEPEPEPEPSEEEVGFAEVMDRLKSAGAPGQILDSLADDSRRDVKEALVRASGVERGLAEVRAGREPLDLRWRDEWTPGTDYMPGDVVSFKGGSWVCVQDTREQPRLYHPDWRALTVIGTISGPAGDTGPQGLTGPVGPAGPVGPTGSLEVLDEGVSQGVISKMDFTGVAVTASVAAGVATVNVTGGGGSGDEPSISSWMGV